MQKYGEWKEEKLEDMKYRYEQYENNLEKDMKRTKFVKNRTGRSFKERKQNMNYEGKFDIEENN